MKNVKIFSNLIFATIMLVTAHTATAADTQYGQYGQYGGNIQSQSVTIDKKVARPGTTEFVDNLLPSDPRYVPNQQLWYQIKVRNTTNTQMDNVTVTDIIPDYIEPVEGPGNYFADTHTIEFTIGSLAAGEERVYTFKMQVIAQDRLPYDRSLICETVNTNDYSVRAHVTNVAEVYVGDTMTDRDQSQLCIEKTIGTVTNTKPGIAIKQVPNTGPEFGMALVALQMAGLGAGVFIKRRSTVKQPTV